jgi:hypothetical protein
MKGLGDGFFFAAVATAVILVIALVLEGLHQAAVWVWSKLFGRTSKGD